MFTLKEAWTIMHGKPPVPDWDGRIYCNETNSETTFRANKTQGFIAAFTFTLVLKGWLKVLYNGHELLLQPDDLYFYSPGLPVSILEASADYRGVCLLADEHTTIEMPAVHDLVQITYASIVQLHEPKQKLPHEAAVRLADKMFEIRDYLHSKHLYRQEIIKMLYSVFLLDIQDVQKRAVKKRVVPQRVEEIFIGFIRILPKHFKEHHDLAFYADKLHISTVYLSRVVRQVSGRTVVDYINQMLLMEASFLLQTSSLSITQIAESLHFADSASFSKFFLRLKGMNPKDYRNA